MIYCIMMFYLFLNICYHSVSFTLSVLQFLIVLRIHNHCNAVTIGRQADTVLTVYTVSLVLGVPTVHRQKQSYLVNTLQSLLYDLSTAERKDIVIVVFVAEVTIYLCSLFLYISPGFICFIAFVRLHQTLWFIISSFLNSFLSSHFIL